MHLSWDPPPAEQHNGQLIGYTIEVKYQTSKAQAQPPLTPVTPEATVVDGLTPNTEYIFEVSAMTAAGSGPPASIQDCTEGKVAYLPFSFSATQSIIIMS